MAFMFFMHYFMSNSKAFFRTEFVEFITLEMIVNDRVFSSWENFTLFPNIKVFPTNSLSNSIFRTFFVTVSKTRVNEMNSKLIHWSISNPMNDQLCLYQWTTQQTFEQINTMIKYLLILCLILQLGFVLVNELKCLLKIRRIRCLDSGWFKWWFYLVEFWR